MLIIKALKIKTSMLFNLVFANKTILSCFFFFFIVFISFNNFFFLFQIFTNFNPTVELAIPVRIPSEEAKVEIETDPVT